jgi:hypothetical protein
MNKSPLPPLRQDLLLQNEKPTIFPASDTLRNRCFLQTMLPAIDASRKKTPGNMPDSHEQAVSLFSLF